MAVNRHDNPAEYKPINTHVSSYVPLPFQEIAYSLGAKQKDHDLNVEDIYNKSNSLNLPTIREHEPAREAFVNQYNQKFMELLDSGVEPGTLEFTRKKKEILDQLARDPRPGVFKRSVDSFKQQQEYNQKLRGEGKYGYYNDPYTNGFQGLDEGGNPLEYKFKPFNPTEDRIEPIYKHFDNAKPSGYEREGFNFDNSGNIIGIKKGYEGIAKNFINNNTESFVDPFLNSNAGRDLVAEIRFNNPDATPKQIREYAKSHVMDIASVYMFDKFKAGSDFKYAPEYVAGGAAENEFNAQAPITFNPGTTNPFQGEKLVIDSNGNLGASKRYFRYGKEITQQEYEDLSRAGNYGATEGLRIEKTSPEQIAKQNEFLNTLKSNYKSIYKKDLTNKQIADLYNKAVDNSGIYIPKDKNFSSTKSDMLSKQVLGGINTIQGLQGKPLELLGPEGGKQINFEQLLEELDDEPIKLAKVQGRTLDHPSLPGSYIVSISTSKGKNIKIAVGADQQTEGWFSKNVVPATMANLSGKDTEWKAGKNTYKTVTVPKEDGSGFATKVITVSPEGTFENDYNEWVKAQHNIYDHAFKHLYTAGYNTTTENKKIDTEEE